MKIGVYTAIYGGKDTLKSPIGFVENNNIEYILFTDDINNAIFPYQVSLRKMKYDDVTKNSRFYKIIGDDILNVYDFLIWHDANIQMNHKEIQSLISKSKESLLTTFIHPDRNCFYCEAIACIKKDKDFSLKILKQVIYCFFRGMPAKNEMYSTGILIKNLKFKDSNILSFWWDETLKFSRRDQLSLAFTKFKTKTYISIINENIFINPYSIYHKHKHENYIEKNNLMEYNFKLFKVLAVYSIILLRKIKKWTH